MTSSRGQFQTSVIIPAYNEEKHIEAVIASVRAAFLACGENGYEVIVCNNNSKDATGPLAEAAGAKVVFEPHNQIARARNAAAAEASGEWLIFIDADSQLSEELLRETFRRMRSGKSGGGGAIVSFERSDLPWHVLVGLGFWNRLSRAMNWAAGSYVFCRSEAWLDTGGFWEEWYAGEEIPFSRRLKKWCRQRGLRFRVIGTTPLITSARKVDGYSVWQLVRLLIRLAWPGALRRRDSCDYWYDRSP